MLASAATCVVAASTYAISAAAAPQPAAAAPPVPAVATAPVPAVATAPVVAAAPVPALAVTLERSGGFAGRQDLFAVDRSTAGSQRVLRMTASPEFKRLRPAYQPKNSCCDRYFYRVTVTYRGGHHKAVSTVQGATAPPILWKVITEVERLTTAAPAAARHRGTP